MMQRHLPKQQHKEAKSPKAFKPNSGYARSKAKKKGIFIHFLTILINKIKNQGTKPKLRLNCGTNRAETCGKAKSCWAMIKDSANHMKNNSLNYSRKHIDNSFDYGWTVLCVQLGHLRPCLELVEDAVCVQMSERALAELRCRWRRQDLSRLGYSIESEQPGLAAPHGHCGRWPLVGWLAETVVPENVAAACEHFH